MLFVVTETQKILFDKYTKFEVLHDALIIYDEEKVKGYFKTSNIVGFYVKKDGERGNINKTIENLNKLKSFHNGSYGADIDNAIKTLEQEPCEDCISRKQALKELKESAEYHENDSREEVLLRRDRDIIRALPSVTPTRKKGQWNPIPFVLDYESDAKCSVCKESFIDAINYNYCPNCGAKMKESEVL